MTSESAREYLESRKSDNSSESSDILSIHLLKRMNISVRVRLIANRAWLHFKFRQYPG